MAKQEEKFFSKLRRIEFGWGAILAVFSGLIGAAVVKCTSSNEPQKFTFVGAPIEVRLADPRAAETLDTKSNAGREQIAQLSKGALSQSEPEKAATKRQIEQLRAKVAGLEEAKKLISSMPSIAGQGDVGPDSSTEAMQTQSWPQAAYAKVLYPTFPVGADQGVFPMPPGVEGYILGGAPTALGAFECPTPPLIAQKGRITFSFVAARRSDADPLSPLAVSVIQDQRPAQLVEYFFRYVPFKEGRNVVEIQTNFEPGKHILRVGYFRLREIAGKYPRLYAKDCYLTARRDSQE
jgi:hypothetical protein